MTVKISGPFTKEKLVCLRAGDDVLLSGEIYTARDAAHKRMTEMLKRGEELPFDIENSIIYYVGPTPAKPGRPMGSAGPTTSYRMDPYAPMLMEKGQTGMIGKGPRSEEVIEAIKKNKAVYFAAIGGAGALMSKKIIRSETVAFEDLGTEALRRLTVLDMPVTVAVDSFGNDLYKTGRKKYLEGKK